MLELPPAERTLLDLEVEAMACASYLPDGRKGSRLHLSMWDELHVRVADGFIYEWYIQPSLLVGEFEPGRWPLPREAALALLQEVSDA